MKTQATEPAPCI